MLAWFSENAGNLVVGAALLAVVVLAVRSLALNRRKGKSSCGCGCAACPMASQCHQRTKQPVR